MKKITSISIGIPAHNEEANIKNLLESLRSQKEEGIQIKEILIMSDGSTDNTVEVIKEIGDERIKVFDFLKKKGKSYRLNQIFRRFTGDVLFIIDADIVINDKRLFSKIIKQTNFEKTGIVGIKATSLHGDTLFEKFIGTSVDISNDIVRQWNKGQNYLAFKGCFLGFERTLAKSIRLPEGLINDDAFMYFISKEKGYASCYLENIQISYKVPATFSDHLNQSSRFQYSKKELQKYFTDIENEYHIPLLLSLQYVLAYFWKKPFYVLGYIMINFLSKMKKQNHFNGTWKSAYSTKQIYYG